MINRSECTVQPSVLGAADVFGLASDIPRKGAKGDRVVAHSKRVSAATKGLEGQDSMKANDSDSQDSDSQEGDSQEGDSQEGDSQEGSVRE